MVAVEQGVAGQTARELPLAVRSGHFGIEATASVSERRAVGVEETHSDTASEHAAAVVCANLETSGDLRTDSLAREKACRGVQGQLARERTKRTWRNRRRVRAPLGSRHSNEPGKAGGGSAVAAVFKTPRQLDDVPSGVATGETSPDVALPVDGEGAGIVAAMNRAWPHQLGSSPSQLVE